MGYHFPPNVDTLVKKQLKSGQYASEDDVLLDALRALQAHQEESAAIQESLDTLDQGDPGVTLEQAFDTIRRRHNVPQA